mgnify:CR=1 FL=1
MTRSAEPAWLKPATDYGPTLAFLAAYLALGLETATAVLIAATLAALALSWTVARRLPVLSLVTAGIVGLFGGLTLLLADDSFIKMKPTIVQGVFAIVLLASLARGRLLLKLLLGTAVQMPEAAWRTLTLRVAAFFAVMAALNEAIWRTQSTDLWVTFDTIGQIALTLIFMLSQVPFLIRHRQEQEAG